MTNKQALNTNHTPGPWNSRRSYSNGEPCGMVITPMGYDLNTSNEEENESNARLIAAAPELLEALKLMVKTAKAYKSNNVKKDFSLLVAEVAAMDAIDKATGVSL